MFPPSGSSRLQSFSQWSTPPPLNCTLLHIPQGRWKPIPPPQFRKTQAGKCILFNSVTKARRNPSRNIPTLPVIPVIRSSIDDWMGVEWTAFMLPQSLPSRFSPRVSAWSLRSRAVMTIYGSLLWSTTLFCSTKQHGEWTPKQSPYRE